MNLENTFETTLYRIPTHSDPGIIFHSAVAATTKLNLKYFLMYRQYIICYTYEAFSLELDLLRKYFAIKGYPPAVIESFFHKKIDSLLHAKVSAQLPSKSIVYIGIPYIGMTNGSAKRELNTIIQQFYLHIDLGIIFLKQFQHRRFLLV